MTIVRRYFAHHCVFRAAHHFVEGAVAEAVCRRPRRRVFTEAVIASGKRVTHVRRLPIGRVMACRAVADLVAAVRVGECRRERVELYGWQAELPAITIDQPQELLA